MKLEMTDWRYVGSVQNQSTSTAHLFTSHKLLKGMIVEIGPQDNWITVKFEGPSLTLDRYLRYRTGSRELANFAEIAGKSFAYAQRWLRDL